MSSHRRPWYPWYPKDFIVDEKVQALSPIAELVYRRALDVMWQANDCQLPSNCQKLANQLGKGLLVDEFENAWQEIQFEGFELFKTTECGGWIYSKRLKAEAEKIRNLSEKRSKLGKKGAQAKAKAIAKAKAKPIAKRLHKQTASHTDPDPDVKDIPSKEGAIAPFLPPTKDQLENYSKVKLEKEINAVCQELYDKNIFPKVFAFRNAMLKKAGNERAVLHTLTKCLLKKKFEAGGPWAYCQKIMSVENGNYNEKDHQKIA